MLKKIIIATFLVALVFAFSPGQSHAYSTPAMDSPSPVVKRDTGQQVAFGSVAVYAARQICEAVAYQRTRGMRDRQARVEAWYATFWNCMLGYAY